MHTSLIITTYNRPDALYMVLSSALLQSTLPDEIVIADDGSGDETRKTIDAFRIKSPVPVIHAWQEDTGFRAARARNYAASKCSGEYLIFIDGDMILHPQFVASHRKSVKQGRFLHGKRAMLSERLTQRILKSGQIEVSPFTRGITLRRYAVHSDLLAGMLSYNSSHWYDTQSANLSMWKQDLIAVNGFNEDFEGWGREDSELALRLTRHGLEKFELRFCAIAFHLAHGKDNKVKYVTTTERNQQLLESIQAAGTVRCVNGIANHL